MVDAFAKVLTGDIQKFTPVADAPQDLVQVVKTWQKYYEDLRKAFDQCCTESKVERRLTKLEMRSLSSNVDTLLRKVDSLAGHLTGCIVDLQRSKVILENENASMKTAMETLRGDMANISKELSALKANIALKADVEVLEHDTSAGDLWVPACLPVGIPAGCGCGCIRIRFPRVFRGCR